MSFAHAMYLHCKYAHVSCLSMAISTFFLKFLTANPDDLQLITPNLSATQLQWQPAQGREKPCFKFYQRTESD
jgi:hypothetical protein